MTVSDRFFSSSMRGGTTGGTKCGNTHMVSTHDLLMGSYDGTDSSAMRTASLRSANASRASCHSRISRRICNRVNSSSSRAMRDSY